MRKEITECNACGATTTEPVTRHGWYSVDTKRKATRVNPLSGDFCTVLCFANYVTAMVNLAELPDPLA